MIWQKLEHVTQNIDSAQVFSICPEAKDPMWKNQADMAGYLVSRTPFTHSPRSWMTAKSLRSWTPIWQTMRIALDSLSSHPIACRDREPQ